MSKKSLLVSAMGVLTGFGTAFAAAFKKRGGTDEELHQLLVGNKSDDFISQIADLAMKLAGKACDKFKVVVDYSRSLAEMIQSGKYEWVKPDITDKHFPIQGQGQVELDIELVHYGKFMQSDEIIQDLDNRGLRPATLPELLAFGVKYPEKQREFPIVALGSLWRAWDGFHYVAYLYDSGSGRGLDRGIWAAGWGSGYRFAALRK